MAGLAGNPFVAALGAGISCALGSYGLFNLIFDKARDTHHVELWNWLQTLKPRDRLRSLAVSLPDLFDSLFGEKFLSLKFFFRSLLMTIAAVFSCLFLSRLINGGFEWDGWNELFLTVIGILLISAINAIPDYFSLGASRLILKKLAGVDTISTVVGLLLADILISALIAIVPSCIMSKVEIDAANVIARRNEALMMSQYSPSMKTSGAEVQQLESAASSHEYWRTIRNHEMQVLNPLCNPENRTQVGNSVSFYASCLTSLWVWLFVMVAIVARLLNRYDPILTRFDDWFDMTKNSIVAVGKVGSLAAGIFTTLITFAFMLAHR